MPINPLDDELEQLETKQSTVPLWRDPLTAKAPAPENPVAAIDQAEALRLRAAQISAHGKAPDRTAQVLDLANRTGLPSEVVERNFDEISKRTAVDEFPYQKVLETTPHLAKFVADPNNAALAHDDMEKLGLLEWIVTAPQRAFAQSVSQMRAAELRTQSLYRDLTREELDTLNAEKFASEEGGALGTGSSWFRQSVTGGSQLLANVLFGAAKAGPKALLGGAVGGVIGAAGGALAGGVGAVPGGIAGAQYGAGVGAAIGGAQFGFELEAGLAYDEYLGFRDEHGQPLDKDTARAAAFAAGAINAGLEVVGLEILADSIPGVKKLKGLAARGAVRQALRNPSVRMALGQAVKEYAGVLTSETAVEVAQRAVTILAGELGKDATDYAGDKKTGSQIVADLAAEGVGALQGFAFLAVPGPGLSLVHDAQRAQRAEQSAAFFQALGEGVSQSETIKRMPSAAQTFLEQATKDGPIPNVYAPVEAFVKYFQDQELDPAQVAAELTGNPDALEQALAAGTDIVIPTSVYAVKMAGTEHHAALARELRLGPDEMNAREAEEFTALVESEQAVADTAAKTPQQQVREQIHAQLTQAGVPASTANAYAALYENALGSMAERAGVDPLELYAEYGLKVIRPDTDTATEGARQAAGDLATAETDRAAAAAVESASNPGEAGAGSTQPAPGTGLTADAQRVLGPGAYAGPDRRALAGAGPEGVERRRIDEPVAAMGDPVGAMARYRSENPNAEREGKELGERARAGRAPAPPRDVDKNGGTAETEGGNEAGQTDGGERVLDADPESVAAPENGGPDGGGEQEGAPARTAQDVPASSRELFLELLGASRSLGYAGSDDTLAAQFLDYLERATAVAEDLAEQDQDNSWRGLLEEISKRGGLSLDAETGLRGELQTLMDTLAKSDGVIKKSGRHRFARQGQRMPLNSVGIAGFPGIAKRSGGISYDAMREHLAQDPRWPHFEDWGLAEFVELVYEAAIKAAAENRGELAKAYAVPNVRGVLEGLYGVHAGNAWWIDPSIDEPIPGNLADDASFDVSEFSQSLFADLLSAPEMPRDQRKLALEGLATDEAMGVDFDGPEGSQFPDGSAAIVCTNCAVRILELAGNGAIYGWEEGTNPTSIVAGPNQGAHVEGGQGHDFAVVDGRYLVDAWGLNVEGSLPRAVFDLNDPADLLEVRKYFGDPSTWLQANLVEGRPAGFSPGHPAQFDEQVDTLDTGEQQPRLPGAGAVRDREVATPEMDAPFSLTSQVAKGGKGKQTTLFQPAYHGSPHKFEAFSLHAIGSGEGAQAYGWGLYFTGKREIAEYYRDKLVGRTDNDEERFARNALDDAKGNVEDAVDELTIRKGEMREALTLRAEIERAIDAETFDKAEYDRLHEALDPILRRAAMIETSRVSDIAKAVLDYEKAITLLEAGKINAGRLFEVEIPDDDVMLLWDKPASQQSAKVQEALRALGFTWTPFKTKSLAQMRQWMNGPTAARLAREDIGIRESLREGHHFLMNEDEEGLRNWQTQHQGLFNAGMTDPSGEYLYGQASTIQATKQRERQRAGVEPLEPGKTYYEPPSLKQAAQRASEELAALGVKGIKYLDGGSRRAGEGTYNFVVFDDKLVEVKRFWQGEDELIIQHNLTAENLLHSVRMGGIPVPALAITKVSQPITGYGEISLVGPKEMADPKGYARTRVFGSDVYSPRYPTVHLKFSNKAQNQLTKLAKEHAGLAGVDYYDLDTLEKDGRKYLQQYPPVLVAFLKEKGIDVPPPVPSTHRHARPGSFDQFDTRRQLEGIVEERGLQEELKAYAQDLLESLSPTERIYRGYTDTGRQSYKPHTLEQVVKILKKELRGGESEANIYGLGQLRSLVTPQFKSLAAIRAAKDRLVSDADFEAVKEELTSELFAIAEDLKPYSHRGDENAFGWVDVAMNVMADSRRGGLQRTLHDYQFRDVPIQVLERIWSFMAALKDMPTEYFEAKITREVDLAEFAGAVVPEDVDPKVLDALKSRGLQAVTYPRGDNAARAAAIQELASRQADRILFEPKRRGFIQFGADRQMTIALLEQADLSTFLHESGHFFLEIMQDLEKREGVKPGITADMRILRDWFGTDEIGTEQHEQFARAFEAYLMEGRAPSLELREVFARFRAWLLGVYRTITGLKVNLTPEVRGVFDRMLAADQAIADAEAAGQVTPIFLTPEAAGMSPAQFELYRETVTNASRTAKEQLERRLLAEIQREQSELWKAQRSTIEGEVAKEHHAMPVYQILAAMQRGTRADGSPLIEGETTEPMRLSKKILLERYGPERLKNLPRPFIYSVDGGLDPDGMAEAYGFTSGDEMLTAVSQAVPLKEAIKRETDRRMIAEHGSLLLDGTLQEAATQAIANEDRELVIRAELRALGQLRRTVAPHERMVKANEQAERAYERRWFEAEAKLRVAIAEGRKQVEIDALKKEVQSLRAKARGGASTIRAAIPPANAMRDAARARVAKMRVRDLRPGEFWAASRRAARNALDLAARQNFDGAIVAKQQELLNLAMYREVSKTRDDINARVRRAKALSTVGARQRLGLAGESYLDQVDGILDRFEFARVSIKALNRRASLAKFIAALEGEGLPVDLPVELLEEQRRINYQDLSVEELVGVTDGLEQILHLARLKLRLLKNKDARELEDVARTLSDSIREHGTRRPAPAGDRNPKEERSRTITDFFAGHRKLANTLREMDGFVDGGPAWDAVMRPLNEAANAEQEMQAEATRKLAEIVERAFPGSDKTTLYLLEHVPAIGASLSRMQRIMVAMNWGNEGNRDRVRRGNGWSNEQVQSILDTLTRTELNFVQEVLDLINSFWPQIEAKQKRVYGIAPEKVAETLINAQNGTIAGGYFPLKYDDRISAAAIQNLDLEAANLAKHAAVTQATTKRGHTKERVAHVKIPVRLDFGPIFEHLAGVIHDLTHHETLIDVGRILGHRDVQAAILETQGDLAYKQIRGAIRDVAFGDVPAVSGFERAINHLRKGATIAGLAWNLTTSLLQPIGLSNSVVRIGPKWVLKGVGRWIGSPRSMVETVGWIEERSAFMRGRSRSMQREISEVRQQFGVNTGKLSGWVDDALSTVTFDVVTRQAIADSYFWMIQQMQRIADIPTWLGQYAKSVDAGETEERAIALADQAVLDSQGGGQIKDLAQVQRGTPMMKLWTNFYSYFNVVYNQAVDSKRANDMSTPMGVGRLASDYLMLFVVPATLGFLIRNAMRPRDGEEWPDYWKRLAMDNLGAVLGTIVGVREVASAIAGSMGYEGPAGARAFGALGRLGKQISEGEVDKALVRSMNDVAGILLHFPAGQLARTTEGLIAIIEGRTMNPFALVAGAPPQKKKGGRR